jgi:hypothetical protein
MYLNEVSGFSSSVVDLPPKDGMSRSGDYEPWERGGGFAPGQALQDHFVPRLRLIGFEMSGF